jgi:PhnB protein
VFHGRDDKKYLLFIHQNFFYESSLEVVMPIQNNPAPEGSSVVSPYLIVKSVEDQLDFLTKVFNAEIADTAKHPDGFIMHAEVKIKDSTIMIGGANEKFPAFQSMIYVYVDDADIVYRKALENGAESVMEPEDRFYGNREGGVKDPQGNTWWIAKFLKRLSKEEIDKAMAELSRSS